MHRILTLVTLCFLGASCASIRGEDAASAGASAGIATQYWFRGAIQSEGPVLQGDLAASIPVESGAWDVGVWANMELSNDTGDAVLPDGNGALIDEIDLFTSYSTTIGAFDTSLGLVSYNFPNGAGGSTHEVYVSGSTLTGPIEHGLTLYYDFDSVEGAYLSYEAGHAFALQEDLELGLSVLAGHMSEDQAAAYFGVEESGISDLSVSAALSWAYDEFTSLYLSASALTVPDSDLSDALEAAGLDDSGAWVALGASWSF